jgi:hypothetical protein
MFGTRRRKRKKKGKTNKNIIFTMRQDDRNEQTWIYNEQVFSEDFYSIFFKYLFLFRLFN